MNIRGNILEGVGLIALSPILGIVATVFIIGLGFYIIYEEINR